jgi:phage tail-like protein
MTAPSRVRLPDLTGPEPPPTPSGWMAVLVEQDLALQPLVSVPSRDDARRCASRAQVNAGCTPTLASFDPPDGTTIVALGATDIAVHAVVTPGVADDAIPVLTVHPVSPSGADVTIAGRVVGTCRDRAVFDHAITASTPNGTYELSLVGYAGPTAEITVALGSPARVTPPPPAVAPVDRCALTLAPTTSPAGVALLSPPAAWPSPPLLAVTADGCIVAAWAVDRHGWVLVPRSDGGVDLLQSCFGGVRATLRAAAPIVDAIFWSDAIAVLTATSVTLYDLDGCSVQPPVFSYVFSAAVALGASDEGFLIVIDSGAQPNVVCFRRDGSRVLQPAAFETRGWYARHRSRAFVLCEKDGIYSIDPAKVATGCDVAAERALTADEASLFERIGDLPDLRQRPAYPYAGRVVLGALAPANTLDAGRPGTQWHRILLFGHIPDGCAIGIQTLAFDDPIVADLLQVEGAAALTDPRWSTEVVLDKSAAGPVEAPGDERTAAGDALVLAGPGRFLWILLTLQSDGRATPRITHIEIEQPRLGTSRFLPKVFRDSTPDDDFLRRWLALFEETAWNGVAGRMRAYAGLFDPRTAPANMLPYLAGWLEIPLFPKLVADTLRLRRVLTRASDLAESRGTIDGIVLAAQLYLDVTVQIVEQFRTRSRFVLCLGQTLDGVVGPALGADTILTAEPPPTYLGDEAILGSTYLEEGDDRDGAIAYHFEVLVPARQVCSSEDLALLRSLIETEKPAHTTYSIRLTAPAGWVLGAESIVGQEVGPGFDRTVLDPATYGIVLGNGPPRPKPLGLGLVLGHDSRLTAPAGPPAFQLDVTVGKSARLGA